MLLSPSDHVVDEEERENHAHGPDALRPQVCAVEQLPLLRLLCVDVPRHDEDEGEGDEPREQHADEGEDGGCG